MIQCPDCKGLKKIQLFTSYEDPCLTCDGVGTVTESKRLGDSDDVAHDHYDPTWDSFWNPFDVQDSIFYEGQERNANMVYAELLDSFTDSPLKKFPCVSQEDISFFFWTCVRARHALGESFLEHFEMARLVPRCDKFRYRTSLRYVKDASLPTLSLIESYDRNTATHVPSYVVWQTEESDIIDTFAVSLNSAVTDSFDSDGKYNLVVFKQKTNFYGISQEKKTLNGDL